LKPAVIRLRVPISDLAIDGIFQPGGMKAGKRSCRMLRNGIVHGFHSEHVAEVQHRHAPLIKGMTTFIDAVRSKSSEDGAF
jgi:hypothetical protein